MPLTRLSSRLTFPYKVLIPAGGLLACLAYVSCIITRGWLLELHGVLAGALLVLWGLYALLALRIQYIYYDANGVRIRNYGLWLTVAPADVLAFEASWLGPLRVLRTPTRNFYFLPGYLDSLAAALRNNPVLYGFTEPASITRARAVLRSAPPAHKSRPRG